MANKRMFDRAIIDTDRFMDLSMATKAMYFLLGMEADDEGFVSYKRVMRIHGGNDDDIRVLAVKGFIIPFESGVVVITDWNNNNWIDSRRARKTEFQEEKSLLTLTDDKKYVLSTCLAETRKNGSTMVLSKCLASIEESRVEEKRIDIAETSSAPKSKKLASEEKPKVFTWNKYLQAMENHPSRHVQIIGYYFKKKNLSFENKEQAETAIRRHLRAAKSLTPFSDEQIVKASKQADKDYPDIWTIETLTKILTR